MSRQIAAIWHADPDAYGPRRARKPCRYLAYVPDPLTGRQFTVSSELAADLVDAERELAVFEAHAQNHDLEQLARFLLRAEAVASSRIEGLEVSSKRLARHAAGHHGHDATADAVLGNVNAMQVAVDEVANADTLNVRHLLRIHSALMEHSSTPDIAGSIRTTQNWIGGNGFNPCSAAFVPPPPEHVVSLLEDLCEFLDRDDLPAVLQAAVAHAQFETIHPFADGNGRTGRALIHVVFRRRRLVTGFVPPVSLALATDTSGYIAGLNAYAYDGSTESVAAREGIEDWTDVFVTATRRATRDAEALGLRLTALESDWRDKIQPRRNSATDRLLPLLIAHPVISADDVKHLTGASLSAAYAAVEQLVSAKILKPVAPARRNRLFEAPEVFQVLTDYERATATHSGDTKLESPVRRVPHRLLKPSK